MTMLFCSCIDDDGVLCWLCAAGKRNSRNSIVNQCATGKRHIKGNELEGGCYD
ncbi:MAG: hypothetical protein RR954_01950 [Christensenellaceae bacterium]